jgi:hypothetical protein
VREVRREIEKNCPSKFIAEWVKRHRHLFLPPDEEEAKFVTQILEKPQYRGFLKRQNILKGLPVADPFVIAAAKVHRGCVVTQESLRPSGARIPTACQEFGIECINLERFFEKEGVLY